MNRKVTKKQFIEALENNEDRLTHQELAKELHITKEWFSKLFKRYRDAIRDAAIERAKALAMEQIENLRKNARKGDTKAAKVLLEISLVYHQEVTQNIKSAGVIVVPGRLPIGSPVGKNSPDNGADNKKIGDT